MAKYLGETGLVYLWSKIKNYVSNYVKITSSTGKDTITAGNNSIDVYDWAQASTKPSYTAQEVGALPSSTSIPSKTSDLTNDSGFITTSDVPEGAAASTTTPLMDGTAAKGTDNGFARGDHVHPTDTSRVAANAAIIGATKTKITYDSKGLVTSGADLVASDIPDISSTYIAVTTKGAASGVCPLNASSKIDAQYLPSYVDDVVELLTMDSTAPSECSAGDIYYNTTSNKLFAATDTDTWGTTGVDPESGVIYVLLNATSTYEVYTQFRWGGSTLVRINDGGTSELTTGEMDTATSNWT